MLPLQADAMSLRLIPDPAPRVPASAYAAPVVRDVAGSLHACQHDQLRCLRVLTAFPEPPSPDFDRLAIWRCCFCKTNWKIRARWIPGVGRADIWLRPGERTDGLSFDPAELLACEEPVRPSMSDVGDRPRKPRRNLG